MSLVRPLSPADVEGELWRLSKALEEATDELTGLARAAAVAEVDYKVAFAKALLTAPAKTVSDREATAVVECEELLMSRRIKEAHHEVGVEKCRTLRAQLSALQSLSANMRGQV